MINICSSFVDFGLIGFIVILWLRQGRKKHSQAKLVFHFKYLFQKIDFDDSTWRTNPNFIDIDLLGSVTFAPVTNDRMDVLQKTKLWSVCLLWV